MKKWEYRKIGDVCLVERGGSPRPIDQFITEDENGINWIKIGDTTESMYIIETAQRIKPEGMKKSRYVEPGDFLLSNSMSFGRPYILKIDGCIHDGWLVLRDKDELFDKRFLYYYLSSKTTYQKFKSMAVGGVVNNLNSEMVRKVDVPVPSKSEQCQIADLLDKMSNVIDMRKQELQKLDELIKARFVELMQTYPSNNLLEEFISAYKAERCGDREIPVLSITKEDGIVFQSEKFKKRIASVDASTYKVVPRGKLVQGIHIDERNFAIQNIADEGIVSPAYKIWNVNEDKAIPEVLAYAMRTDRTMAYISSKFTGSVKRRESISMNDFMATPINLPSIKVQTEFYNFMKQTDKSKFAVQKALDEAQLLFESLMQKYFG